MADIKQWYEQVYTIVKMVPRGRVATYGQIARLAGLKSPRQSGQALSALPEDSGVPWFRVINSAGRISLHRLDGGSLQRALLLNESVEVSLSGRVDLSRFGWNL
jgi:methylated-DNA-protein-cysteine methyltransferase-like protein